MGTQSLYNSRMPPDMAVPTCEVCPFAHLRESVRTPRIPFQKNFPICYYEIHSLPVEQVET